MSVSNSRLADLISLCGTICNWSEMLGALTELRDRRANDPATEPCPSCSYDRVSRGAPDAFAVVESSILDTSTARDNLRWALAALELVKNGLRNRRHLAADDVEMLNLKAATQSVDIALQIIRGQDAKPADGYAFDLERRKEQVHCWQQDNGGKAPVYRFFPENDRRKPAKRADERKGERRKYALSPLHPMNAMQRTKTERRQKPGTRADRQTREQQTAPVAGASGASPDSLDQLEQTGSPPERRKVTQLSWVEDIGKGRKVLSGADRRKPSAQPELSDKAYDAYQERFTKPASPFEQIDKAKAAMAEWPDDVKRAVSREPAASAATPRTLREFVTSWLWSSEDRRTRSMEWSPDHLHDTQQMCKEYAADQSRQYLKERDEAREFASECVSDEIDATICDPVTGTGGVQWMRCSPGLPAYIKNLERENENLAKAMPALRELKAELAEARELLREAREFGDGSMTAELLIRIDAFEAHLSGAKPK